MRNHYCGALGAANIDETVTLCGWVDRRRDHGGVIFLDLRDREGIVQVVFDPDTEEHFERADRVRGEYVLQVTGRVRARTDATINPAMATVSIVPSPQLITHSVIEALPNSEPSRVSVKTWPTPTVASPVVTITGVLADSSLPKEVKVEFSFCDS